MMTRCLIRIHAENISLEVVKHSKNRIKCAAITSICSFIHFCVDRCSTCSSILDYGYFKFLIQLSCSRCAAVAYEFIDFIKHFASDLDLMLVT